MSLIGMNVRYPGLSARSLREEVSFARTAGFDCLQFAVRKPGDFAHFLGVPLATLAQQMRVLRLTTVMEIVVRIDQTGKDTLGQTPFEVLKANLPVILALNCTCVHWHLVPTESARELSDLTALEESLLPDFVAGVELAARYGFRLGFEHNEPQLDLFATPGRCSWLLERVDGLGFVWDFNHTLAEHLDGFLHLTPRMTMLHVSDTPLPLVNYHLPLGKGNIDFAHYCAALQERGFDGPAILEIGGLPQSGGYGQDTDAALVESRALFLQALQARNDPVP